MQVQIRCKPAYAIAYCVLESGETLFVERGAMAAMSTGLDVGAAVGKVGKALKRKVLGGEGLVYARYTAEVAGSWVAVAPTFPGDVGEIAVTPTKAVLVEAGAVLAHSQNVELDAKVTGLSTVILREGVSMLKITGDGSALVGTYGGLEKLLLAEGESTIVDTGHLVGMTEDVTMKVGPLGSVTASALTGEGLVALLTGGPGGSAIWIQTRAEEQFRTWLFPEREQNKR